MWGGHIQCRLKIVVTSHVCKVLSWPGGLKSNFEVCVLWVGWCFFDFGVSDIAGERIFYVPEAIVNIIGTALREHLNNAVRHISDEAGQWITIGYPESGKTKADTMDLAGENYMFGCLNHQAYLVLKVIALRLLY